MERLNYQHLFYFWNVAKEGSISRACEKLHLAQPTISGQLIVFEQAIGEQLFRREGRKLFLTDTGRVVYRYAEEIFGLGRELANTLKGQPGGRGLRLSVGVADALPKLVTYRLIEPALRLTEAVQVICYEDKIEHLLGDLSLHALDLVLSDVPATPKSGTPIYNHLLGESEVAVFGSPEIASIYRENFFESLHGAPFLLPTVNTSLRRSLDHWFESRNLRPRVLAEIEDSALLKTFASACVGLFVAPIVVEKEAKRQYGVESVGRIDAVTERFYAVTAGRKLQHPAVTAILENARQNLFGSRKIR
ncbi:MAG: transcriptional activator NhaR [Gammaproteobacteria bacterium]